MKVTVQEHEDIIWALEYCGSGHDTSPKRRDRLMALRMKLKAAYETTCEKVNGK